MKPFYRFIVSMKKYILFGSLLAIVFLWLGNKSMAVWSPCGASLPPCPYWEQCLVNTCIASVTPSSSTSLLWASQIGDFCTNNLDCAPWLICFSNNTCITNPNAWNNNVAPIDSSVPAWKCVNEKHDLIDQPSSINTYGGWCDCEEWFKQVGKACLDCKLENVCCGIELNTKVPFIGKCIEDERYGGMGAERAFPNLMWALTQILVTVILLISFVLIVIGGIMIATGDPSGGKKMIMKVVIGIAILGASWVILRLINPNFFG